MKPTSKFLSASLLLAAMMMPQLSPAQGIGIAPVPTTRTSSSTEVREIERRVLKEQLESTVKAASETMEAMVRTTQPEEQKRLLEQSRKYAEWAESLNRQLADLDKPRAATAAAMAKPGVPSRPTIPAMPAIPGLGAIPGLPQGRGLATPPVERAAPTEDTQFLLIPTVENSLDSLGGQLNEVAWDLLTDPDESKREPAKALAVVEAAFSLPGKAGGPAPEILDTKARALFMLGRKDEAIATQKQAMAACGGNAALKTQLAGTLAAYEKGELPSPETAPATAVFGQAIKTEERRAAYDAAVATLRAATEGSETPDQRNAQAWELLKEADSDGAVQALALVHKALAETTDESPGHKHMLDTKARAMFILGAKEPAITIEQEAIKACGEDDADLKALFERTVESYRKGELPEAE